MLNCADLRQNRNIGMRLKSGCKKMNYRSTRTSTNVFIVRAQKPFFAIRHVPNALIFQRCGMAAAIENVLDASRRFINRRGVIQRANEQGLTTRRNDSAVRQGDGQLVRYSRPYQSKRKPIRVRPSFVVST